MPEFYIMFACNFSPDFFCGGGGQPLSPAYDWAPGLPPAISGPVWDTVYVVIRQLPLLREEFRLPKLTFHSDLRRRAVSRRALPSTSSF